MDENLAVNDNEFDAVSNGTETKIVLNFARSDGTETSLSYKHCKQDCSNAHIKALMQGIIANGAIFEKVPVAMKSAKVVTTETVDVDLS